MEPRFFKRGNTELSRSIDTLRLRLQWNHVFSNVEMSDRRANTRTFTTASMEPRFFKRGNTPFPPACDAAYKASMEPRFFKRGNINSAKHSDRHNQLQWNHVFSNVEMQRFAACNCRAGCFNGTTFFQTWKFFWQIRAKKRRHFASMEPRFFKRGNRARALTFIASRMASMEPRFFKRGNPFPAGSPIKTGRNASMEPRFFKRGNYEVQTELVKSYDSFNGTTFFQTWKSGKYRVAPKGQRELQWNHVFSNVEMMPPFWIPARNPGPLQWNHVFSNVEIHHRICARVCRVYASMEPRFFKRGNDSKQAAVEVRNLCFNGTTFFQTWKSFRCAEPALDDRASMEPRFFKRGNLKRRMMIIDELISFNGTTFFQTWKYYNGDLRGETVVLLQWNHVFSNVEMLKKSVRSASR